jgi:hypothetical protein
MSMSKMKFSAILAALVLAAGFAMTQQPTPPRIDYRSVAPLEEMHTKSEIKGWLVLHGMPGAEIDAVLERMRLDQVTSWDSTDGKMIRLAVYMVLAEQNKTFKEVK